METGLIKNKKFIPRAIMYTDFGGGLNDNLKGQKHKEVSKLRMWGIYEVPQMCW